MCRFEQRSKIEGEDTENKTHEKGISCKHYTQPDMTEHLSSGCYHSFRNDSDRWLLKETQVIKKTGKSFKWNLLKLFMGKGIQKSSLRHKNFV